jgi:HK97 family phage prohead protease
MEYFYAPFECKADNSNDGTIRGYGSTFGNIDSYGDTVAKGAFAASLRQIKSGAVAYPPMLLQHGGMTAEDQTPCGIWTSMEESDVGLKVVGKLAIKTQRGSDIYELMKLGAFSGLSIGYRLKKYEKTKTGRLLTEIALAEISLVTFPANSKARVLSVKSHAEPVPVPVEVDWKAVARADYDRLAREMTKHNRNWR